MLVQVNIYFLWHQASDSRVCVCVCVCVCVVMWSWLWKWVGCSTPPRLRARLQQVNEREQNNTEGKQRMTSQPPGTHRRTHKGTTRPLTHTHTHTHTHGASSPSDSHASLGIPQHDDHASRFLKEFTLVTLVNEAQIEDKSIAWMHLVSCCSCVCVCVCVCVGRPLREASWKLCLGVMLQTEDVAGC